MDGAQEEDLCTFYGNGLLGHLEVEQEEQRGFGNLE